jgi:hypothetical protein
VTSYFIYYRCAPERARELAAIVNKAQTTVRVSTGISGRLMRRNEATSCTFMEIYEGVADNTSFEATLDRALAEGRFVALLAPGEHRHTERFIAA